MRENNFFIYSFFFSYTYIYIFPTLSHSHTHTFILIIIKMYSTSIFTKQSEWPLQEYQEQKIMHALSQTLLSPNTEEEEESITSYFPENRTAIFHVRRQPLSTSLRCSICQRRFHSQGNLSNHNQLYH